MNPLRAVKHYLLDHWIAMMLAAVLTTAAWIYGPLGYFARRELPDGLDTWEVWVITGWDWRWLLPVLTVSALILACLPRAMAQRTPEIARRREQLYQQEQALKGREKDLDERAKEIDQQTQDLETRKAAVATMADEARSSTQAWVDDHWRRVLAETKALRGEIHQQEQALGRQAADLDRQRREIAQAQAELARSRQDAETKAAEIMDQARQQAEEIITDARRQAEEITDRELLTRRVAEREAEICQRERELEAQAAEVENLRVAVNRRNGELQQLARSAADTLAQAQQISTTAQARAEALDRRESQLQALASDLDQRGRDLADQESRLQARASDLDRRESRLQAVADDLDRRERDLDDWDRDISDREAALDAQTQELLGQAAAPADNGNQQPQHQVSQAEQWVLNYLDQRGGAATRKSLLGARLYPSGRMGRILADLCRRGLITCDDEAPVKNDWTYTIGVNRQTPQPEQAGRGGTKRSEAERGGAKRAKAGQGGDRY